MSLTPEDLDYMRVTQNVLMPDLAAVSEKVRTADGVGGFTETWVAQPQSVICRIGSPTAAEAREIQGRMDLAEAWAVSMPVEADVKEGYRVTIGGTTYDVAIRLPVANWQSAVRLIVRRA